MKRMFVYAAAMGIAGMMALSAAAEDAYIQSAGSQVIDTGYYPNPTTRIVIDFDYVTLEKQVRFFGTRMTDVNYLTLEMYNPDFNSPEFGGIMINDGIHQPQRLKRLNEIAIHQMRVLSQVDNRNLLK